MLPFNVSLNIKEVQDAEHLRLVPFAALQLEQTFKATAVLYLFHFFILFSVARVYA